MDSLLDIEEVLDRELNDAEIKMARQRVDSVIHIYTTPEEFLEHVG